MMDIIINKLPPNIRRAVKEKDQKILEPLVRRSITDLQCIFRLNRCEAQILLTDISSTVLGKKILPVLELPQCNVITTGCKALDTILEGGISSNGISEIYGPSGVGKTQICLQLCITTQIFRCDQGLQKGVVYISTEDAFPSKRLLQLVKLIPIRLNHLETQIRLEDNIFIDHVANYECLKQCLNIKLPKLLRNRIIGLIIIDSIAGIFRSENENVNYFNRSVEFLNIATKLNKLSQKYKIPVVCVNQVTDNLLTGESEACLGLSWKNLVTHRFSVTRVCNKIRKFEIIFSPFLKSAECNFVIKDVGVVDV